MPRPSSWLRTTASTLVEELARIGLTVPIDQLEYLLTDRVATVAEQMHITKRTARQYFDHDTLHTLAHEMALSIKEETEQEPWPTDGQTLAAATQHERFQPSCLPPIATGHVSL